MDFKLFSWSNFSLGVLWNLMLSFQLKEVLAGNAYFPPINAGEPIGEQFLQGQPTNYFETSQTLPSNSPADRYSNGAHYQGYNYQSPASTYGSYSTAVTGTHETQTSPLALSLHADDYEKFDKASQTFFVPRNKKLLSLSNNPGLKTQEEFYVPRANSHKSLLKGETVENKKVLPSSDLTLPNENQQNWKPLSTAQDYSEDLEAQTVSNDQSSLVAKAFRNSVYAQQKPSLFPRTVSSNNEAESVDIPNTRSQRTQINLKSDFSTFQKPSPQPIDCSSNLKKTIESTDETLQLKKTTSNIRPSQGYDHHASSIDGSSLRVSGNSQNSNGFYLTDSERQQRIEILKSLLAEYLALTLPEVPQARNSNLGYEQSSRNPSFTPQNTIPSSFHTYNEAVQYRSIPRYRPSLTTQLRQPHLVYGTPFAENLNANLENSQNPQSN